MTCSFWLVFPLTVWQNFNVLPWCCFWRLVPNFRPIPVTKNSLSPFHHKRSPQSGVFSSLPCASMTLNLNASWVWGFFDRFSHPTSKFFDSDLPVSSPCSTQKIILPEDHSLLLQQNPQTRFSEKFFEINQVATSSLLTCLSPIFAESTPAPPSRPSKGSLTCVPVPSMQLSSSSTVVDWALD